MLLCDEAVDYFACLIGWGIGGCAEAGQASRTHSEVSQTVVA